MKKEIKIFVNERQVMNAEVDRIITVNAEESKMLITALLGIVVKDDYDSQVFDGVKIYNFSTSGGDVISLHYLY